ncbi:RipA family octameric membrane protein [Nocardia pseudovaccinii]|uniref:RipA family octameric membrane protein n=1 Tax=Nocardia pseudovaccinii TaxID=189540 RepID=UPI0007A4EB96|nr:hypothetical protein [Nocardia pseudovaccinii]
MSEIPQMLWNEAVGPSDYTGDGAEKYRAAVLDQYKLCVEMADRVSARRNLSNTFFLTMNTAVVAAAVAAATRLTTLSIWLLAAGLLVLLTQCAAWFTLMRSYRLLNSAKYAVIGAFEQRLPAYAYSRAEWVALGEGRDWRKYLPLTHIEQWVPGIFALAYMLGFLAAAL